VLRDRKALSNDGIIMVVVAIDQRGGARDRRPGSDFEGRLLSTRSRRRADELRAELKTVARRNLGGCDARRYAVKEHIRSELAGAVWTRTKRRPVVIP